PRRIAVVPAYNEEPTVAAVLEELYPLVDELVVVDDGSTDDTRAEIERWIGRGRPKCRLLVHEANRGMSEAYHTALTELRERLPHLPPRSARTRTRLLLGLPIQRDRRGRGRALPARLRRPQRSRRPRARGPVAHATSRRGDRPRRHPGRRRTRVATRQGARGI